MTRKNCFAFICLGTLLNGLAMPSRADLITITFESVGSGDLDGQGFTDESFVITAYGDTNNRMTFSDGFFFINDSATITFADLNGGAPIEITTVTTVNLNTTFDGITFGNDVLKYDVLLLFDSALNGYDLLTSLPAVSGTGFLSDAGTPLQTSAGILNFATSEPTVNVFATSVPEPSSFALLGFFSAFLCGARCRSRQVRERRRQYCNHFRGASDASTLS